MLDEILIRDLEVFAHHGVLKEENVLGQKFLVSAVLAVDTRKAGRTDQLAYSVNYAAVCELIQDCLKERTFSLIEAAAEYTARRILLHFSAVQSVRLTIKKPWAPVMLSLQTVGVTICRGWSNVYLSIGSNMGDKKRYLDEAVSALRGLEDCRVTAVSDYIVTEPWGNTEQEEFLNGAVALQTLLSPYELLEEIQKIEAAAGRERKVHWGPRTLDIDILMYGDLVTDDEVLTIPHPFMEQRAFVLQPLAQIAPLVVHPLLNRRIRDLAECMK